MNNITLSDVTKLADYPTLKKLASALWQQNKYFHGAAIMVGSGFSRSAASTITITNKPPLWKDLCKIIGNELNTSSDIDPLRLAEEYCAYFGKQALHDLLKRSINDTAWIPGELHKSLLELPWNEVITTNWDTLLERASTEVHQPVYNIVSKQEDLSHARSPRIVKLHGTINVTADLIFTQEDYRTYPQTNAAFVNFTRQVFIENELCLLGFSGDDPNFLQWAGWVRDKLTVHARCIYLVGALNLTSAKRKYLESLNIAPIDLSNLVSDYDEPDVKHLAATKIFIETLQYLKPKKAWEWHPVNIHNYFSSTNEFDKARKDPSYAATLLEEQIPILEADRNSYPGWLVCPYLLRRELQEQLSNPFPTMQNIAEMKHDNRIKYLYEIAWRYSITYCVPQSWLIKELLLICDPVKPCVLTKKQQMEIALFLLKTSRWLDSDESKLIIEKTSAILKDNTKYWPDSLNELTYYQAIIARDNFNYEMLEDIIEKIDSIEPIWKLKKSSLLAEIGRFKEGEELVTSAYRNLLNQYRKEPNSVYITSRLAWVHWILRGIEIEKPNKDFQEFPSHYQESLCSPWEYIEYIQKRISNCLEKQQKYQSIEPLFEPGYYKDNTKSITFSNEVHPYLLLEGISNTVGMPFRWSMVGFLNDSAAKLTELEDIEANNRFTIAIQSANSDDSEVIKKIFSRTWIACLKQEEVDCLLIYCKKAIKYWLAKLSNINNESQHYALQRLRVFIEVLARCSIRSSIEQAKELFRLACTLGEKTEFHHVWLCNPLKHLIEYSLKSIPETQHNELLLDALSFPLPNEISNKFYNQWPNPIIETPGKRQANSAIEYRINTIIDSISLNSNNSTSALSRLLPLAKKGYLKNSERKKIAEKIWGKKPNYSNLPKTNLYDFALLMLPTQDQQATKNLIKSHLYENKKKDHFDILFLENLKNASIAEAVNLYPTNEQAIYFFNKFVNWRENNSKNDLLGKNERQSKLIGEALAYSIVPSLSKNEINENNFKKLSDFYKEVNSPATIIALTLFSATNKKFVEPVEKLIRQGLQDRDTVRIINSSYAILKWRELDESLTTKRLILRLIYQISSNRINGLQAIIWTANELFNKKLLSNNDIENLVEILPIVFDNINYFNITPYSKDSITASLVKTECVKLIRNIFNQTGNNNHELLRVLEEAKLDPLPEVRFAVFQ